MIAKVRVFLAGATKMSLHRTFRRSLANPARRRRRWTLSRRFGGMRSTIATSSLCDNFINSGTAFGIIGGSLMAFGVGLQGSHRLIWVDACIEGGIVLVLVGTGLVTAGFVGGLLAVVRARRRRPSQEQPPPNVPSSTNFSPRHPASADAIQRQPQSPLVAEFVDDDWRLVPGGRIWVFGVAVRFTNVSDKPVTITDYSMQFVAAPHSSNEFQPRTPLLSGDVREQLRRLARDHCDELLEGEITVEPLTRVVRWHLTTAFVPEAQGGRPQFTFSIVDSLGNTYDLDQRATPPQRYQMS
jgi:hypothetical protein